jgi:hypothetical protein
MRTLKRPMFKIGGKAEAGNDGIMSGLVDRKQLQNGTALQKFQSIGDIQEIIPYNMKGAEIKDKYDFDFPINLKSTFIAENPQPQNIETTSEGDIFYTGGKPEFKKKPDEVYLGQKDPQGSLEGITFPKTDEVKKLLQPDTEPKINLKDDGPNVVTQAEKNDILKARAKEFEELLNPGARKRVINNALAAASAQFGKSEGNTMSDIANAITAAAGATGKMDEIKQKAAELAIGESIQKGIYASKPKTKNAVETMMELIAKGKRSEDNPEGRTDDEEAYFQANIKGKSSEDRFLDIEANLGRSRAVADKYKDDKNFAGVLPFNKKDQKEFINNAPLGSVVYMNPPKDSLYEIIEKDGKKELQFLGKEKG